MAQGARQAGFDEVIELPLADGGEGTLDTLLAARGGSRRTARVTGPLGDPVDAQWGVLTGGVAIVEMAQASGLALVHGRNDPLRASTRGTGELIAAVRAQGFNRVIVAVGGSATTDGGLAAVEALGWSLQGMKVTVACDVESSFADAATLFAPQKGATGAQVALLGRRLQLLADQYRKRTGVDVTQLTGAGAAGGLAGGLAAIGAELAPGFDVVAEAVGLESALEGSDLALTGEGKLDASSLAGKVVGGVLAWAADMNVASVAVIAGQATDEARAALAERPGVQVLALTDRVWQSSETYTRTALLVEEAAIEAARTALGTPAA
jgi:glycerate 2-kinase